MFLVITVSSSFTTHREFSTRSTVSAWILKVCCLSANPARNANLRFTHPFLQGPLLESLAGVWCVSFDTSPQMSIGLNRLSFCLSASSCRRGYFNQKRREESDIPRRMMCSRCISVTRSSALNQELIVNASAETPVSSIHQNKLLVYMNPKTSFRILSLTRVLERKLICYQKSYPTHI